MERPERIDVIVGDGVQTQRNLDCPGALLVINRHEYDELSRSGEVFRTKRQELPVDARGDARVVCSGQVMTKAGLAGDLVLYALCASCASLESNCRQEARARAEQAYLRRDR